MPIACIRLISLLEKAICKQTMDAKLQHIYYSPKGYWRGLAAVKKLAAAAKVSEADARSWLKKQAIWQIYLPAPRQIPRPVFDEDEPNAVHQADLLYLPHDRVGVGRKKNTNIRADNC